MCVVLPSRFQCKGCVFTWNVLLVRTIGQQLLDRCLITQTSNMRMGTVLFEPNILGIKSVVNVIFSTIMATYLPLRIMPIGVVRTSEG